MDTLFLSLFDCCRNKAKPGSTNSKNAAKNKEKLKESLLSPYQQQRQQQERLWSFIDSTKVLPTDLLYIILQYLKWTVTKIEEIAFSHYTWGLATDHRASLYIAGYQRNCIYHCSLRPTLKLAEIWTFPLLSLSNPYGLDLIDDDELWITDSKQVQMLDLKTKTILRSWLIPGDCYGIKVSEKEVFISLCSHHQINIYNRYSGHLIRSYGDRKQGSNPGTFSWPYGLTVDEYFIYICDAGNYRVQVLSRNNGSFHFQLGGKCGSGNLEFNGLRSIYLREREDLLYIGDRYGLKVFTKMGEFLQRCAGASSELGEKRGGGGGFEIGGEEHSFCTVVGIAIVNNQFYISDLSNSRIQVWS